MVQRRRRQILSSAAAFGAAAASPGGLLAQAGGGTPKKVFRYAFPIAESTFDPVQVTDLYSRTITPHIFESPYGYDHLARPLKLKPLMRPSRFLGEAPSPKAAANQ